ncbi:hypothetical protein D1B31_17925 [Neobacillus notoginsengisoli]|uniref:Uncharacterized protein n=1 Tax=Neobacillus notoginsengisoli TaxID=1578198 RepID=A0A417YQS0_9BACI|nr:hypothetical protein D1B31_17925 [Neobacillus notoginsengisoli]
MSELLTQNEHDKDLNHLEYDEETLLFLRAKLDEFTIEVFRKVIKENKVHKGLVKTRLENFHGMRKRYDAAFLMLEAQGFIYKVEDGTATPYFATVRGKQLAHLLHEEKLRKEHIND